jgi:pimeloyl-ACP methyl ester carboxylesterase
MARTVPAGRTYPLGVVSQPPSPAFPGPEPVAMVVPLADGVRLHYLAWPAGAGAGTDVRPVVLVHGLTRTAWTWLPVGRRLASAGIAVAAPDLRGHGASDAPLDGYDLESLALDVLTVAAGAGWGAAVDGPAVVLAGHGLGALVAVEAVRAQPDSIAGLVLLDGGWEAAFEATHLLPDQLVEAMAEPPEVLASMDAYLADRRDFDPPTWDADQERAARAQVVERHAGHVRPVTKGSVIRRCVSAMYGYRPLEALSAIACPVSLLVAGKGTADDEDERERRLAIEDVQGARAHAGREPMAVTILADASHDLMRYRPDVVAEEIARLAGS